MRFVWTRIRTKKKKATCPQDVLDAFGCLYYVRTLPLDVGQTYTFTDVHDNDKISPAGRQGVANGQDVKTQSLPLKSLIACASKCSCGVREFL